jgi:hypothetical protein
MGVKMIMGIRVIFDDELAEKFDKHGWHEKCVGLLLTCTMYTRTYVLGLGCK